MKTLRMKHARLLFLGTTVLGALTLLPRDVDAADAAASPDLVEWGVAKRATASSSFNITGRVIPQDGALNILSARVTGRVTAIMRREGEVLQTGENIFRVSSAECTSLATEKQVAQRRGGEDLLTSVTKREQELSLKIENGDCFITASNAGVLTKRNVEVGSAFNPGDALGSILDTKRLAIELDIPERDLARVKVGQQVRIRLATDSSKVYETTIQSIIPAIDSVSRVAKARLNRVNLPPHASLDSLVFGEIRTLNSGPLLQMPSSALVFRRNNLYVIRGENKKPSPVQVNIVAEAGNETVVRPVNMAELKEGDPILVKGAIYLLNTLVGGDQP